VGIAIDTLVVPVPVLREEDLNELARRCRETIASLAEAGRACDSLRKEAVRQLRVVQQAMAEHGGKLDPPAPPPKLKVVHAGTAKGRWHKSGR
jgi:hypothetical protein